MKVGDLNAKLEVSEDRRCFIIIGREGGKKRQREREIY